MSIAYGWQPSEWLDFTISEVEFALEQAEIVVDAKNYEEWSRAGYIVANLLNINSGNKGKKYTVNDLIKHPKELREKQKQDNQQKVNTSDKDALRKIALDKGLNPNF